VATNREALIEKLVVSLHLNVAERRQLGVSGEEATSAVKRILDAKGVFPPNARIWAPGDMVFEGFFLVKRPHAKVDMIWQRSSPTKPTELSERRSEDYEGVDQAITRFIEKEWSNGIDGIRVVPHAQRKTSDQ
jgi:hypothetical protein